MNKISTVVNVVDAEVDFLPDCLNSVKSFSSEIIIVDMSFEKKDELEKIAKKYNAKVYSHPFVSYVEPARNFGISKVTNDWILIIDPDERIGRKLSRKLQKIVVNNEADYVNIPRKNIIFNKWIQHSRWWPDYNVRFFKKGKVEWGNRIHSIPITNGVGIDLLPNEKNAIEHLHYSSIEQFIERMNRYTTQQAKNLYDEGASFAWTSILTKPLSEFNSRFFKGQGYKDGVHGLVLCSLQSFSELVSVFKLWQLYKFQEKSLKIQDVYKIYKQNQKENNYWISDLLIKENKGLNIKARIKRKLKI